MEVAARAACRTKPLTTIFKPAGCNRKTWRHGHRTPALNGRPAALNMAPKGHHPQNALAPPRLQWRNEGYIQKGLSPDGLDARLGKELDKPQPPLLGLHIANRISKFQIHISFEAKIALKETELPGVRDEIVEEAPRLGPLVTERDLDAEEFSAAACPMIIGMHREALPSALIVEVVKYDGSKPSKPRK
jgi:hypothetical protein